MIIAVKNKKQQPTEFTKFKLLIWIQLCFFASFNWNEWSVLLSPSAQYVMLDHLRYLLCTTLQINEELCASGMEMNNSKKSTYGG